MASQSLLWEHAFATAPTRKGAYDALRVEQHPLASAPASVCLWERLQTAGTHTTLLTDDCDVREWSLADPFAERVVLSPSAVTAAAESWEQTQLCQLFLAAVEWLSTAQPGFCLYIHSRGMSGPWDAPRELREQCADVEDPPVPDFVEPPRLSLGPDPDPDEVLGVNQAYAGQIVVLDRCLDLLLEFLSDHRLLDSTLLVVSSPRGFPLGEHDGQIGECGDRLHEELLHIPLLVRRPDQRHAMERCQALVELTDLYATLADWFQVSGALSSYRGLSLLESTAPGQLPREYVVSAIGAEQAIRTPAWFLTRSSSGLLQLYAKPDDRWEVNEVADRCGEIAQELAAVLDEFIRASRANDQGTRLVLPEHLMKRL
jgi:hypothetical protein